MKYCSYNRYQEKDNAYYEKPTTIPVIENVESF